MHESLPFRLNVHVATTRIPKSMYNNVRMHHRFDWYNIMYACVIVFDWPEASFLRMQIFSAARPCCSSQLRRSSRATLDVGMNNPPARH